MAGRVTSNCLAISPAASSESCKSLRISRRLGSARARNKSLTLFILAYTYESINLRRLCSLKKPFALDKIEPLFYNRCVEFGFHAPSPSG